MCQSIIKTAVAGLLVVLLTAVSTAADPLKLLVFSRTTGFRHASIDEGIAMIGDICTQRGWSMTASEDPALFTDDGLTTFNAVVFLSTTGDVLNDVQQGAFERYIQAGGGFVGIHSASDTEFDWPWFGRMVGAYFSMHPAQQTADLHVENDTHPACAHLPPVWTRFDEWYNFRSSPSSTTTVLLRIDENSYNPGAGAMGVDHPMAWCHLFEGGRSFYTALGHTEASYTSDSLFRRHIEGGIEWVTGLSDTAVDIAWSELSLK